MQIPAPTQSRPADATPPAPDARIRALLVSTSFPADLDDWRGLFMRHKVDALARREDIDLRIWAPRGDTEGRVHFDLTEAEQAWLESLMAKGGIAHLYRQAGLRGMLAVLQLMRFLRRVYHRNADADLYHVNWLQNILPMPANTKPLLVTVLGTDMQLLRLPGMRALLRRVFRGHPTVICPNADWMVAPLQQAFGDVAGIEFLPFGIDPGWFRVARNPQHAPARWIAVTRLTRAKLGPLFPWCAPLFANGDRELHLFGPMQESIDLPAWVHYHGPASPDTLRDNWFPTATGLITLSQHAEGRPQVMLEAMASGLPILASALPAHASFMRHGETGWLCDASHQLVGGLAALEDAATNRRIGEGARAWATHEVGTWDDCAERYLRIYHRLLGAPAR